MIVRDRVSVNLRLAVYRQSVHLGDKPHEAHGQISFGHLPRRLSLYSIGTDLIENTAHNSSAVVVGRFLGIARLFI
jgi:hypothetical protein